MLMLRVSSLNLRKIFKCANYFIKSLATGDCPLELFFYGNQKNRRSFSSNNYQKDHFQQLAQEKEKSFVYRMSDKKNIQVAGFPIRVNDYFSLLFIGLIS